MSRPGRIIAIGGGKGGVGIQGILKEHPSLSIIWKDGKDNRGDEITIDNLERVVAEKAPDIVPLIKEIRENFRPMLIINRRYKILAYNPFPHN